jgi:hypothetical protein
MMVVKSFVVGQNDRLSSQIMNFCGKKLVTKQAKLQWLQDPSEINGDNLSNIRRETSRHFRNEPSGSLKSLGIS